MFPFLAIFIVFVIILTYYIKKNDSAQSQIQEDFWEKERLSNAVRKKDISNLDYINIPFEKIPQQLHTSTEEAFFAFQGKPMLNLTGISNTDLKLTYGTANLTILSEYDTNFTDMVALLPQYAQELMDAGYESTAQELLEFAVSAKADSRKIYNQLATIYQRQNAIDQLTQLSEAANQLPELTRMAIQKDLATML